MFAEKKALFEKLQKLVIVTPSAWLKERVHQYGASKSPAEIFEGACGAPFDAHYYVNYLKEKYAALNGIAL